MKKIEHNQKSVSGRAGRWAYAPVALVLFVAVASTDDSSFWRYDASRSGVTTEIVPPQATPAGLSLLWETTLPGGDMLSSACVGGGRAYFGGGDGKVYACNAADGSLIWTYQTGDRIVATPAYYKGRLYVGSRDGHLYILHAATGALLIDIFHGGDQLSSPVVANDVVYFCPGDPSIEVRAYNALTGAYLWSFNTNQITWNSPTVSNGRVFVGNNSGTWYALDAVTGTALWTYATGGGGVYYASPAVEGNVVVLCSGNVDRYLHILNADTGTAVKAPVLVVPPASSVAKVGGTGSGEPSVNSPEGLVHPTELEMLLGMTKPERDKYIDGLATRNAGVDYAPLKQWLDEQTGTVNPSLQKPSTGQFFVNLSRMAQTSSPAIVGGKAFLTHRELSGTNLDEYYTVAIETSTSVASASSVLWGTTPSTQRLMDLSLVPSPSVSTATYVYNVHGVYLQIRQVSNGTKLGEVNCGRQVLGSPVLANGRVFVTGAGGWVGAYQSGNQPPIAPTAFSPSGGTNITATNTPTLTWSGQSDPESAAGSLTGELQIGVGSANQDLELQTSSPILIGAGSSSYLMGALAANSHVYWRVRSRDPNGAYSPWSATQDFWVNRDTTPPDPPQNVTTSPGDQSVMVEWSPSPSADVVSYSLWWKPSTSAWSSATLISGLTGTTRTVSGLTNGTTYDFMLAAVDAGENLSTSVIVSGTPVAVASIIGGGSYATIQAALNAAQPGQTVLVGTGTFNGNLIVPPGVSLRGYSPKHTTIRGNGTGTVITVQGTYGVHPTSTIQDLVVENGVVGIGAGVADVSLLRVILHHMAAQAVTAGAGRLRVVNCTLMANGGDGIYSLADTAVRNSIVAENNGFGMSVPAGSSLNYNAVYQNVMGFSSPEIAGIGNHSVPVEFKSGAGNLYREKDESSAVDAGDPLDDYAQETSPNGGRINQGAFGNTQWAGKSRVPTPGRGGGGGCGSIGLDLMLLLLVVWGWKRFQVLGFRL